MVNKRSIAQHREKYFVNGFNRYVMLDKVIQSKSFEDIIEENDAQDIERLFKEFQFYNCIIKIEELICDLLFKLHAKQKVKNINSLKKFLINKIRRYRGLDEKEAIDIIDKETMRLDDFLLSPNTLFYICGFGLGDLLHCIRGFTEYFRGKETLVKDLSTFNNYRTDVFHNPLSSRINIELQLKRGLKKYKKIDGLIKRLTTGK